MGYPYYEVEIRTEREKLRQKFETAQEAREYYDAHTDHCIYARLLEHWGGYARFIAMQSRSY